MSKIFEKAKWVQNPETLELPAYAKLQKVILMDKTFLVNCVIEVVEKSRPENKTLWPAAIEYPLSELKSFVNQNGLQQKFESEGFSRIRRSKRKTPFLVDPN